MSSLARIIMVGLASFVIASSAHADAEPTPPLENDGPRAEAATGTAICGHVGELMAAQQALRANDRAKALIHLKEARRILSTCEDRIKIGEEKPPALSI